MVSPFSPPWEKGPGVEGAFQTVSEIFTFATSVLELVFRVGQGRARLHRYGFNGQSWLHSEATSGLFATLIDGQRFDAANLALIKVVSGPAAGGDHIIMHFSGGLFEVEHHIQLYKDTALLEMWQVIRNQGSEVLHVTRIDSLSLNIPAGPYELLYYTSDWGQEFEPVHTPLTRAVTLETRFGRSSKGQHPWFALSGGQGVLSGSVAWSGNWVFRFEPLEEGGWQISGGLHDWSFAKDLLPGHTMESPRVVMVLGDTLNTVSQQYACVGRRHWYPRNALSAAPPVEWNHWFSYEDADISDPVFRANVAAAAEMGMELCVLDAGWFGPSDAASAWYEHRGDWDMVNAGRFPHGLRTLSDETHARGLKFGLWCEIEGVGKKAALAETHPELVAMRGGEHLGYLCFGNPQTQEWAYDTLCRLISTYACDWIKLDFNLEPGAGCDRTDHGHGSGDGLYEHYRGYYRTLERVRQTFPEVVLENCSSGGLRIDLGILRRTDLTFLSDPDWPVHDLQIFWGASTMLAPDACLHWSFSEWRSENRPPQQTFNPHDPRLARHQLDMYTRLSMVGACGFSQKLPELPTWVRNRLIYHIHVYKNFVRRFVREADLYRLTAQPRRDGSGDRWCAFQYSLPDRSEHLLFVFRLPGAEPERAVHLVGLQPDRLYRIEGFEGERIIPQKGQVLMEHGLVFSEVPEEGSVLLRIS